MNQGSTPAKNAARAILRKCKYCGAQWTDVELDDGSGFQEYDGDEFNLLKKEGK
jgi:hypothetical protein